MVKNLDILGNSFIENRVQSLGWGQSLAYTSYALYGWPLNDLRVVQMNEVAFQIDFPFDGFTNYTS